MHSGALSRNPSPTKQNCSGVGVSVQVPVPQVWALAPGAINVPRAKQPSEIDRKRGNIAIPPPGSAALQPSASRQKRLRLNSLYVVKSKLTAEAFSPRP
jgi:hypothetical protein